MTRKGKSRRVSGGAAAPRSLPPLPTTKISETILAFGAPLLELVPQPASEGTLREALTIVITIWNACVMATPFHGQPGFLRDVRQRLAGPSAPPLMATLAEELIRRREEQFAHDPRAVGEWDVLPDGIGGFRFRCDARAPGESFARS